MWSRVQVTAPGELPVSVDDLRARLRVDSKSENALLASFLATAASQIEGPDGIGVAMMAQTWTLTLDAWAGEIDLPGWPVSGVEAVRYLDAAGASQTLDHGVTFRLVVAGHPSKLVLRPGAILPAILPGPGVIEIDYTLGRADPAEVDPALVTALSLLAGHYYENREATTPHAVKELPLGVAPILARFSRVGVA